MLSLAAAKAANAAKTFPSTPVALFVGGTSGIGQASAEALARYTKGDAHIILSGRNEAAASKIIAGFPQSSKSTYEFLPCDATLLSNVATSCRSLTAPSHTGGPIKKLNYLFLSPGYHDMRTYDYTSEGFDKKMTLYSYARWKYVMELLPLLQAARDAGEDARVVSILGTGNGLKLDLENIGLVEPHTALRYIRTVASWPSLMSNLCEEFAERNPGISFTHACPGYVDTNMVRTGWFGKFAYPLKYYFLTAQDDCAEWMVCPLFDASFATGAFHIGKNAESVPSSKLYITQEARTKLYEHIVESVSKY